MGADARPIAAPKRSSAGTRNRRRDAGDALETARLALARREAALELALDERAVLPEGVEPLP
jgi:hypothetical protein